MNSEQRRIALLDWIGSKPAEFGPVYTRQLNEVLYAMSELRLWPDNVDSVSEEQAVLCWCIAQRLRLERFPDSLRM